MLQTNYFKIIQTFLLFPVMVICSRYNYLLFENFEVTKASFIKEQNVVRKLETIRRNLHQIREGLCNRINDISVCIEDVQLHKAGKSENWFAFQVKMILDHRLNNENLPLLTSLGWKQRAFEFSYNYSLSGPKIMDGAQKGIIMLQETYDQNIKEFSHGHLHLQGRIENNSRRIDSLQPDDLASMSTMAFTLFKWYDNALTFLKQSISLFNNLSKEERSELPSNFGNTLLKTKKQYAVYHNDMLYKKQSYVGPEWKLFPYMVDKGS